ncbi:putative methyltransferase-domain-containing protein [Haematococcus lacustris]
MLDMLEQHAQHVAAAQQDIGGDWQRFYLGYAGRFVDDCVLQLQGGVVQVRLAQAPSAKAAAKVSARLQTLDKASDPALTGTTVWDGAVVLAHYLSDTSTLEDYAQARLVKGRSGTGAGRLGEELQPLRCIELGAGTGAVSLALLACRKVAQSTLTDIPDMLPWLRHNVERNHAVLQPHQANIQALRWGSAGVEDLGRLQPSPPYDVILGADLIYYSDTPETPHSRLLLWTLQRLAGDHSLILLALSLHHNPEEVSHFLQLASQAGFLTEYVDDVPAPWLVPDVMLVRLVRLQGANGCPEAD